MGALFFVYSRVKRKSEFSFIFLSCVYRRRVASCGNYVYRARRDVVRVKPITPITGRPLIACSGPHGTRDYDARCSPVIATGRYLIIIIVVIYTHM